MAAIGKERTEEMRFPFVGIHLLVLVRDTALLERDPNTLDEWAELGAPNWRL